MIRMTGLNSGLDTDSIVQALMSAQRMKKTKVTSKKTKLEWKKDEADFIYECPFLINNRCCVYSYRGIICRTFGLAYFDIG